MYFLKALILHSKFIQWQKLVHFILYSEVVGKSKYKLCIGDDVIGTFFYYFMRTLNKHYNFTGEISAFLFL